MNTTTAKTMAPKSRKFRLNDRVRVVNAVFPDGEDVTGVWLVIGRQGGELMLERYDTTIRCPAWTVVPA